MKTLCVALVFASVGVAALADEGQKRTSLSPLSDQLAQLVCYGIEDEEVATKFTPDAAQECVELRAQGVPGINFYRCLPVIVNDDGEIIGRKAGECVALN